MLAGADIENFNRGQLFSVKDLCQAPLPEPPEKKVDINLLDPRVCVVNIDLFGTSHSPLPDSATPTKTACELLEGITVLGTLACQFGVSSLTSLRGDIRNCVSWSFLYMDRLSYLPDQIQGLILSFLPTEDAIRTRVLSSDWRYICPLLSEMVFNQYHGELLDNVLRKQFKTFVDQTLLPDGPNIKKMTVFVDVDEEVIFSLDIMRWIAIAAERNVQELYLWAVSRVPQKLPSSLYTNGNLKKLALHHIKIQFPATFTFPMLKHLTLDNVVFCGYWNTIEKLLLSANTCPVLEELVILYCYQLRRICTYHPTLRYLKLFTSFSSGTFDLSIPTLQEIDYSGIALNICRVTLSSLVSATFQFDADHSYPPQSKPSKILTGVNNMCTLNVKTYFIEYLSCDRNLFEIAATLSFRLKHFHCHIFPTLNHFQMVLFILNSLEGLETLHINVEELPRDEEERRYLRNVDPPFFAFVTATQPYYPALKRVEFKNCTGSDMELYIVSTIFMCAPTCEELSISFWKLMDPSVRKITIDDLLSMEKINQNSELIIAD